MTLQQVLDFLAVAHSGGVRAAARATGQTQPAPSKSLRRLEDAVGVALLARSATEVRCSICSRAGLGVPSVSVRCESFLDTLALLAGSDLIGAVPAILLGRGFLKDALVALPLQEPLPAYQVSLFRRASSPLTPAAGALVAQFERQASYLKNAHDA